MTVLILVGEVLIIGPAILSLILDVFARWFVPSAETTFLLLILLCLNIFLTNVFKITFYRVFGQEKKEERIKKTKTRWVCNNLMNYFHAISIIIILAIITNPLLVFANSKWINFVENHTDILDYLKILGAIIIAFWLGYNARMHLVFTGNSDRKKVPCKKISE